MSYNPNCEATNADREYRAMRADREDFKYEELRYELHDEERYTYYRSRWAEDRAAYSTPGSDW